MNNKVDISDISEALMKKATIRRNLENRSHSLNSFVRSGLPITFKEYLINNKFLILEKYFGPVIASKNTKMLAYKFNYIYDKIFKDFSTGQFVQASILTKFKSNLIDDGQTRRGGSKRRMTKRKILNKRRRTTRMRKRPK